MLHEVQTGACSKSEARRLRLEGGLAAKIVFVVDSMSVFAAVTAVQIKVPAESSLLSHIQFLRELLDNNVVEALAWTDTRDMVADGLTKSSVDRTALLDAMAGSVHVRHESKLWRSPLAARASQLIG